MSTATKNERTSATPRRGGQNVSFTGDKRTAAPNVYKLSLATGKVSKGDFFETSPKAGEESPGHQPTMCDNQELGC
ncbi:hypothetical protein FOPE_03821 [Fonsecaea pedrosoi]|nr:hypothetical protein FOPE_03821 [Fonsecaea pedrosoi]